MMPPLPPNPPIPAPNPPPPPPVDVNKIYKPMDVNLNDYLEKGGGPNAPILQNHKINHVDVPQVVKNGFVAINEAEKRWPLRC